MQSQTVAGIRNIIQVVDEDGNFNDELADFVRGGNVGNTGTEYQIVAITGPQSSGKSTLMNVVVSSDDQMMTSWIDLTLILQSQPLHAHAASC